MPNISINHFVDGFIAFLFAISGPIAIMLSITNSNQIDVENISVWLFGCFAVNGFLSIIVIIIFKQPLIFMWSIPGIILIGFSLNNYSIQEIVGVYLITSFLLIFLSFTNLITFLKKTIPTEIVMGMVAGIFMGFCVSWIKSLQSYPLLSGTMTLTFFIFLILSNKIKFVPPLLGCLIAGLIIIVFQTDIDWQKIQPEIVMPFITLPEFNKNAIIELTIPLIITVIFIQNGQGLALLESKGYKPPVNHITYVCGFGSFFNAYFGSVSTCLTGPVTGIIINNSKIKNHTISAIVFSLLCILFGLYSPTVLDILNKLPNEFIITLGGLALLTVLKQSFIESFKKNRSMGALITFLITISGFSLFNIGAPFWGLVSGFIITKLIENDN